MPEAAAEATAEQASNRLSLYGSAEASAAALRLTAGHIEYVFAKQVLRAAPRADSLIAERPSFSDGEQSFSGERFTYNLREERGRVVGAQTQIDNGYLLGGVIKQTHGNTIYVQDAAYTTCPLDHPHYAVVAGKLKVIDGKQAFTGPIQLRLLGLPTPIWLPFAYIPTADGRRSGPLAVSYGQSNDFGLYLEDLGWYFAVSDYFDTLVKAQVGTTGSFRLDAASNYARRYAYSGRVSVGYGRVRRGESTDPDYQVATPIQVGWSHQQTFPSTARLTANVDLQSNSQRFVSDALEDQVRQTSTSRVTYNQSWNGVGRSLSATTTATQNFSNGSTDLTLPSLTLAQQRRFPFRKEGGGDAWYEQIGISYSGQFENGFDYPAESQLQDASVGWVEALFDGAAYERATGETQRFDLSASHRVPVSASFTVNENPFTGRPLTLNLTPSLTYTESWYDSAEGRTLQGDSLLVRTETPGFTAIRRTRASLGIGTEVFGTFPFRIGRLNGFRHVVRPRVNLSFEPDYGAAPFNYVRETDGPEHNTQRYAIAPGVPLSPTRSLSFTLDNAFLTRIENTDSTGRVDRRVQQVLRLNLSGGVNFAADRQPVEDVSLSASSNIGRYRLNVTGGFSPYARDSLGRVIDTPLLSEGGFLRTNTLSLSASTVFQSSRAVGSPDIRPLGQTPQPSLSPALANAPSLGYDPALPDYATSRLGYVDFSAPWSVSLDFSASYRPTPGPSPDWTAVLAANQFNFQLSPAWAISGSTGFDLVQRKLSTTQLALRRDLHCWEMQLRWVPFGVARQFGFSIYVKSGFLRDLLRLDLPNADFRSSFRNVTLPS